MGERIQEFRPAVRRVNGLLIYWVDKETTQVSGGTGPAVTFHRWAEPIPSSYPKWRRFNRVLIRNNSISDTWQLMRLATRLDIDMAALLTPKTPPPDIAVYPSTFSERRAGEGDEQK